MSKEINGDSPSFGHRSSSAASTGPGSRLPTGLRMLAFDAELRRVPRWRSRRSPGESFGSKPGWGGLPTGVRGLTRGGSIPPRSYSVTLSQYVGHNDATVSRREVSHLEHLISRMTAR
jgi:hypothetical protein